MKLRLKTFEVSNAALRGMELPDGPKRAAAKKKIEAYVDTYIADMERRGDNQKIIEAKQRIPELEAEIARLKAVVNGGEK